MCQPFQATRTAHNPLQAACSTVFQSYNGKGNHTQQAPFRLPHVDRVWCTYCRHHLFCPFASDGHDLLPISRIEMYEIMFECNILHSGHQSSGHRHRITRAQNMNNAHHIVSIIWSVLERNSPFMQCDFSQSIIETVNPQHCICRATQVQTKNHKHYCNECSIANESVWANENPYRERWSEKLANI